MASRTIAAVLGLHLGVLGLIFELGNFASSTAYPLGSLALPMALVAWAGGLVVIAIALMQRSEPGR